MVALLKTEISNFTTIEEKTLEVRATKNFIQNKVTGRVDTLWDIFEKTAKKFKFK